MGTMILLDATTRDGREATAQIVRGLGDGKVCVWVSAAEERASIVRNLGEGFAQFREKTYGPFKGRHVLRAAVAGVSV